MERQQKPDTTADNNLDMDDLPDNENQINPEEVILDIPEVTDIPGNEETVPPKMNTFHNTGKSSDDDDNNTENDKENRNKKEGI